MEDSLASTAFGRNWTIKTCNAADKGNNSTFRSVTELSSGGQNLAGLAAMDMVIPCSRNLLCY